MSRFERLAPSTVARTVGTGLPTFPLGLTEEMVIVPPEPVFPPPLLVPAPVVLVALLTVARLLSWPLACTTLPISAGFAHSIIIPQREVHQTLVGKHRGPLTASYSPECVEVEFSETRRA